MLKRRMYQEGCRTPGTGESEVKMGRLVRSATTDSKLVVVWILLGLDAFVGWTLRLVRRQRNGRFSAVPICSVIGLVGFEFDN